MITIPGYKIVERIHHGAKTAIYRGYTEQDQIPVTIKAFQPEYPITEGNLKIKHEYNILKKLDFPGVLNVYALERYEKRWALVMEFFNGKSLKHCIAGEKISVKDRLNIGIQLTSILDEFHCRKVIHKDIKPSNILYDHKTKRVKIIDFSIASLSPKEKQPYRHMNTFEGTLAYMSPEQTGRINRNVDCRTDFYSLGVTMYELLTGQIPFDTTDPLEMVHFHIAKTPVPVHILNPDVPVIISDIVMKLMAKSPDERYQSAYGIKADMQKCLTQLEDKGYVEYFSLGKDDISDRFCISHKLYNRSLELKDLMFALDSTFSGQKEMTLVSGPPGIGKTRLIQEVNHHVQERKGHFISGKFEQFHNETPYYPLIHAFRELIFSILTENEENLLNWKKRLSSAVGVNGQLIIDVIPEVELIIGKQPDIKELSPTESKNRFSHTFKNFVNVFCQKESPLVLFIDDLQWADLGTLDLIGSIMGDQDLGYLLFIGAYRDNEAKTKEHLLSLFEQLEKNQVFYHGIQLTPFKQEHIERLICDTFRCNEDVSALGQLIYQKTYGNPFFVKYFMELLYEKNLIYFDSTIRVWKWDINKIKGLRITDNVVELLREKIENLPAETREVLQYGGCVGNDFDLEILSQITGKSMGELASLLEIVVSEGLLDVKGKHYAYIHHEHDFHEELSEQENHSVIYNFVHDQIQQAAYLMVPDGKRKEIHYKIGMWMLKDLRESETDDRVFDILKHLNICRERITDGELKEKLAFLNYQAGKRAKASAAFRTALKYFTIATELLENESWEKNYTLTFDSFLERAECAYLNVYYEEAEKFFDLIQQFAKSDLDKARIFKIRIVLYINQDKVEEAVALGLKALRMLKVPLVEKPSALTVARELFIVKAKLLGKNVEDLLHLPVMSDPTQAAAMDLLMSLTPVAYMKSNNLLIVVVLKIVSLSLTYGNSYASAFGYGVYGLLTGAVFGNYEEGYQFGKLGLNLNDRMNNVSVKSKCNYNFGWFLNHWRVHAAENIGYLKRGYHEGLESGDMVFAVYCCASIIVTMFVKGDKLEETYEQSLRYATFVNEIQYEYIGHIFTVIQQGILNLKGLTKDKLSLTDDHLDERILEEKIKNCSIDAVKALYYVVRLQLYYIYENYQGAVKEAEKAGNYIEGAMGLLYSADYYFYYSLTLAAVYMTADVKEQQQYLRIIKRNQKKMKKWADHCPENFLHKYLLVEAELSRILGMNAKAGKLYNEGIVSAFENEYRQNCAVGNELAARFYLSQGLTVIAEAYMNKASALYGQWGAVVKVKRINEKYPDFFQSSYHQYVKLEHMHGENRTLTTHSTSSSTVFLDMAAVLKMSHAISKEIVFERMLENLMRISIENAGAEKGLLCMIEEGSYMLKAMGTVSQDGIEVILPGDGCYKMDIPVSIINYVMRTEKSVVLNDARSEPRFAKDDYIQKNEVKSALCSPIIQQGKLLGVLYMENNLTTGAFTADRVEILNLLSTQAAISIVNASMYEKIRDLNHNLEEKIEERTRQLKVSMTSVSNLLNNAGQGFLTFGKDLLVEENYSAECRNIFGYEIKGRNVAELLFEQDQEQKDFVMKVIPVILNDKENVKRQLYMPLLPNTAVIGERHFDISYKIINDPHEELNEKIMMIMTDITLKKDLENKVEMERNILKMVVKAVVHHDDFMDNVRSFREFCEYRIFELVGSDRSFKDIVFEIMRSIHTFKGNFSQLHMVNIVKSLHDFESWIYDISKNIDNLTLGKFVYLLEGFELEEWLDEDLKVLEDVLGKEFFNRENILFIDKRRLVETEEEVAAAIDSGHVNRVLPIIKRLRYKTLRDMLSVYPNYVMEQAERLGKSLQPFEIIGGNILVESERFFDFTKSLTHVFRNCIDHGIEPMDERVELGKEEQGRIGCSILAKEDTIVIQISDDGRGIDLDMLREKALEKGIYEEADIDRVSKEEILSLVFRDDFSTKEQTTELSGRGVGLAAVMKELKKLNGKVEVKTEPNNGTEFRFVFPYEM
ncbi:MAG: protein kinase domain-containing protein [Bacillota bacterium]